MKKLIIAALSLFLATGTQAQNAKQTADGNFVAVKHTTDTAGKATGKTFTDAKGNVFPVYESKNGKLYYFRVSKAGNVYKQYLKL